ncbi:G protein pathway suppressor 2 [Ischnura elegans]|uniref:G protein pathway suppressor 2 n=1 Tax=Ischnura elegans TaxID=197161 RepID=UPI001ED867A3|nr:G protein pathway suppressor 2 [Ischnura elegans]
MPAVLVEKPKRNEAMWNALRAHIVRERQKKKQEQEADAEVERQRKERERQQKQDVMTLGETREQISHLEIRLSQLKDEKHQLFLQLKKVLNEDDIRRRQLVKESNEMMNMHGGYPTGAVALGSGGHPQIFLQPNMSLAGRMPLYKGPPGHGHTLLPPLSQYEVLPNGAMMGALKRTHSPSPPLQGYHQGYGYKPATMAAYPQQKVDDGRRGHEYVRAVLWNKNSPLAPYPPTQPPAGSSGAFYSHAPVGAATGGSPQVVVGSAPPGHPPHSHPVAVGTTAVTYAPSTATAQTVYTYAGAHPQYAQAPPGAPAPPRDEAAGKHLTQQQQAQAVPTGGSSGAGNVYMSHVGGPPRGIPHNQAYVGSMHQQPLEHVGTKGNSFPVSASGSGVVSEADKYYSVGPPPQSSMAGIGIRPPTSHVPMHAASLPIQQPSQGAKTGSITSGYPIRAQQSPHVTSGSYVSAVSTPHSVYVSQAPGPRLSYSQAGPPHGSSHPPPPPPPHGRYSVPGMQREV